LLLEGRTALVTGASRGIGAAIARALAAHGARLVLAGRSESVEQVAAELRAGGAQASAVRGDLREDAHVRELVQHCRREMGGIDLLVNNAGMLQAAVLGMASGATVRELFEVNAIAPILLTQYAIRLMDPARRPSIVHVASIAGTRGTEKLTAYSASKGALVAFALASAKELAPRGIRVNAIAPGYIDTDMVQDLTPEMVQCRIDHIGMGRFGTAAEVADTVVFLGSDLSRYVTGQVIGVDGGMQA
jgi:3-oxoacyl-[acyl-carrier protein] reductase